MTNRLGLGLLKGLRKPSFLYSSLTKGFSTSQLIGGIRSNYYFDTYQFAQRLEAEGFTRKQAEAIVSSLDDVLTTSMKDLSSEMVTKEEQEKTIYTYKVDFAQLKSEVQMLEKNDFALMKSENEKLAAEVETLKRQLKDDLNRTQSGFRLDMNLEKGRLKDEANLQMTRLNDSQAKIEQEIYNLKAQLENIKFQILQYMVGTITGTSALILAYLRMFR